MGKKIIVLIITMACVLAWNTVMSATRTPPFRSVKIYGQIDKKYNKVSLFESGSSKKPFKTSSVRSGGKYSLSVSIPKNMRQKESYYLTDMRFWDDKNNNGVKDDGEAISQCHFIIWRPSNRKIVMQIYNGPTHEIKASKFKYNYQ